MWNKKLYRKRQELDARRLRIRQTLRKVSAKENLIQSTWQTAKSYSTANEIPGQHIAGSQTPHHDGWFLTAAPTVTPSEQNTVLDGWHRQLICHRALSSYRKPGRAKPRSANWSSVELEEESDQKQPWEIITRFCLPGFRRDNKVTCPAHMQHTSKEQPEWKTNRLYCNFCCHTSLLDSLCRL